MQKEIELVLSPKQASSEEFYLPIAAQKLKLSPRRIKKIQIKNRSIDARKNKVNIQLRVLVSVDALPPAETPIEYNYKDVTSKEPVIIIGAGPAGLFAALKLLEWGLKPIVIERGKDVHKRRRDIAALHKNLNLNPDSNYGFGEGGAGTFSDGKLFTRSKKRGSVQGILNILKYHGAHPNILIDAHPHIGSDKLPDIIKNIRRTILNFGGEVHFQTRLEELILESGKIAGIKTGSGDTLKAKAIILATGHSAHDIYEMLNKQGIALEAKPFAMGVRIEHPQELIDSIQYSCPQRGPYLPAATYSLVQQIENRGVYTFCMCPGGVVVPASTAPGEMVVNGMSPSNRSTRWANSGMVVEIKLDDVHSTHVLDGLAFQREFERLAFKNGGGGQIAPAQRAVDFFDGKLSNQLPESSFRPGLHSSPLHEWMPENIRKRLQLGLQSFGQKMKGYFTNEALLIGVESRTSSPLRIPRDAQTFQHPQIQGLFPSGEGAGYAGGIVSSAIDGENCALKVSAFLTQK
ncbi:MAG: NAD(P)/FAD-dependent oxidoreductase [Candidatus Aminicenantes bacterium]|nr:NAD(P)/FAD-dependent oxidoreductase [Candidatus Aminicenantes bacterium]